jgi:hypothetical protein
MAGYDTYISVKTQNLPHKAKHSIIPQLVSTVWFCCKNKIKMTMLKYHCNCANIDVRHAPTSMLCWWRLGWMQEQISGAGQDILFLTDDPFWLMTDMGMYIIGLPGLYDYDGHNASWQCHKVYFLSSSTLTQDGHNASWQCHKVYFLQVN